jgi:NAD(P)-dependent dehydrogenase (short-subunit alcohol dehydrogenase family)
VPLIRDWSTLLDGRSAIVTGAGARMGRAIAHQLARAGATVWVNDLYLHLAETVASEITADGCAAHAIAGDVCDLDSVRALREQTGPLDILVNNAGTGVRAFTDGTATIAPFVESTPEQWEPVIAVNFYGVLHMTHTYLPSMLDQGWGRIVTIVSDAGRKGERGQAVYGAAKAAAMGFMRGIAQEGGRKGVTANCVALGTIGHEGGAGGEDSDQHKALLRPYPVGRIGQTEDPAPLVVLLCSDAGEWITGQVYPVNGGYTSAL